MSQQEDFLFLPEELSAKNLWSGGTKKNFIVMFICFFFVVFLIYRFFGYFGIVAGASLAAAFFYLSAIAIRLFLFIFSLAQIRKNNSVKADSELSDEKLPVYTILVPLRNEDKSVPGLISSLKNLDWPRRKLEIILLVDEDDDLTRESLDKHKIPSWFSVLTVPASSSVRSKPRVLNAALSRVSGEILTIYDAEDRPEADQLKKAHLVFRDAPDEVVCVQARLDYYNENKNLLTMWFASEYASWFGYMLPALDYLGLPVPLGGTSNHIKTDFLKKIGGWDPYNVTEDCDLGMRIYRTRGKVRMLSRVPHKMGEKNSRLIRVFDSVTYEEASAHLGNWIRQRSRWIKGFLQTFFVHFRHPVKALREFGIFGFAVFAFFTAGTAIIHLTNIVFWALFIGWLFNAAFVSAFFPEEVLRLHKFSLIFGNAFFIAIHVAASLIEKRYKTAIASVFVPFYWALMAIAALKAIWQLAIKPHYWEKTAHFGEQEKGGLP